MAETQTEIDVKGQEGAGAGTETGATTDVQDAGAAQDTGAEGAGWTPSWRQQQAANRSGLTDEEVGQLVDVWGEERASAFLDQRAGQHDELSRQAIAFKSPTPDPNAQDRRSVEAGGVPEGEFALSPELLDQSWEQPEVVAKFFKPVVDELNATRRLLRTVMGQVQEAGDRTTAMTADMFFASLGDQHRDIFGEGPTNVRSTEQHQQARLRVIRSAEKIAEGFSKAGTPLHSQEALERALSMEMGEKLGTIARNRAETRARRRASQTQAGPRGRRETKPATREQRKDAFVRGAERIEAGESYERGRR